MFSGLFGKREWRIIWILVGLLSAELLMLIVLIYFAKLVLFFYLFLGFLRLVSPFLLVSNIAFLVFVLFGKGKTRTAILWTEDLRKSLKFFALSFVISIVAISVCACLGALLGFSAAGVASWHTLKEIKEWIALRLY